MGDDLDGVLVNIRASLLSSKGPMPLRSLMRDYETLVGSSIPYRQLNYPTIESFLQSLPSLRVYGSGRDMMVEACLDRSSSHISSLISKQKSTKKRDSYEPSRRGPSSYSQARGYTPRYAPRYSVPRYPAPKFSSSRYDTSREARYSAPRDYARYETSREAPRESAPRNSTSRYQSSSQHSQPSQTNNGQQPNNAESMESLVVRVEGNERRQVSVTDPSTSSSYTQPSQQTPLKTRYEKYEVPPRLQKSQVNASPSVNEVTRLKKDLGDNLYLDQVSTNGSSLPDERFESSGIISPLGPSQLIAAGRAQQQAAQAQFGELLLQDDLVDGSQTQSPPIVDKMLVSLPEEQPVAKVPQPDYEHIPYNVDLLEQYTRARGWPDPEYTKSQVKNKGPKVYVASVKISRTGLSVKKYSSYPHEDPNIFIVKGHAAKKALENLIEEEKVKFDTIIISTNKNTIADRISEIVAGSYNGIFSRTVEEMYIDKYKERLPDDWIQTVNSCPTVSVECTLNSFIILPKDPTIDPVLNEPLPAPVPLALEFPPDDNWSVYVTYATSTNNVWFRLIGENYSDKYEELLTNMEFYYTFNTDKELALNIVEGQYYVAHSGDGWLRVCVCEVNEDSKTVEAWLIDHGEKDIFPFKSLFWLTTEFRSLPRQAVQCSLEGLENFSDDRIANEIVSFSEDLVGKSLIAQITFRDLETGLIKATLFDTSGTDDVNINEKLLDSIYVRAEPELPNEGCAMEVYISSVSKRGEVFLQIAGPAYDRLNQILSSLEPEDIAKHKLTSYRQVALNKTYLAKYSKDSCWYRAVVTATPSVQQNKIAVRFIDFGNAETVSISDIAEVTNLPSIISHLPPQALKVALHNLPVETLTNAEVAKLHCLLRDEDKVVLIKTIKIQDDPPVVEIFCKDNSDDSHLMSVNSTIEMQRILQKPEDKKLGFNSNFNSLGNGHDEFICTNLKRPEFDEDFMAVLVVLAANPGNFIFQPLKYAEDLKTLMKRLQAYYDATALPEIAKEDIVVGGIYAAQYIDEAWYRVIVTGAFIGSKVPIRFCDYGDMYCISISDLRELEPEFQKIPFIAVKGKLAGVLPLHTDWSVEDCIRFQELVVDKVLASVVTNVEDNFANPMEMVVSLHLVDTSSDKDKVISEILVNENRALKDKP